MKRLFSHLILISALFGFNTSLLAAPTAPASNSDADTANESTAATPAIGVVDVAKVLQQSPQADTTKSMLKSKFQDRANQLDQQQQKIQELSTKLKKDGVTMQPADRQALEKQLAELQQKFVDNDQAFQRDFEMERNQYMTNLLTQLKQAIAQVATENGLQLILSTQGVAYYDAASLDMTDLVSKKFNAVSTADAPLAQVNANDINNNGQ